MQGDTHTSRRSVIPVQHKPVRILHIVARMDRGGVETWLMHAMRKFDRAEFQFDFLLTDKTPGTFDAEIERLGGRIIICSGRHAFFSYCRKFLQSLRTHGPYDVVHSHVHHASGITLALARFAGVKMRIAHSHVDMRLARSSKGALRRCYLLLMRRQIRQFMTHGLACSVPAAEDLFGMKWRADKRVQIMPYGIDLNVFRERPNKADLRSRLALPADAIVIGHVANFSPAKNHLFLLEIAAEAMRQDGRIWLVLVGDGELKAQAEQHARELGISKRVKFLGTRADVPQLMMGAMDVFLFPSLFEGLPVVLIEAQAAGLPCVISGRITKESDTRGAVIARHDPSEPTATWAATVLKMLNPASSGNTRDDGAATGAPAIETFGILNSVKTLAGLYASSRP